jgi:DNA ligase-1
VLHEFAQTALLIAATTKKSVKESILASYLTSLDDASLERATVFFTGSPFPRKDERVSGVGWATIADAVAAARGVEMSEIASGAGRAGDLADGIAPLFEPDAPHREYITLLELGEFFDHLAATSGGRAKTEFLTELYRRLRRDEARFVTKILLNEFRIGLQEGLVESAVARAFSRPLDAVRRANMFTGDIGATALLARAGTLESAAMTLFHPIGFMLAQPEESASAIIEQLGGGAIADDKYDGIRAQLHADGDRITIYSRTLDEISARFPEVAAAGKALGSTVILDGEIIAFDGRILPFATLQKRIGRRKLTPTLLAEAPVAYFAFDVLYAGDQALFELPLTARLERLRAFLSPDGAIRLAEQSVVQTAADVDAAFDAARRRGNEGLVVKAPESIYTPGRRGKSWLKLKKALATLDCVVTAAEYGHGKRRGVLSDYTFAVWRERELVNIGKAYSGLTDAEIDVMTARLKEITTARHGPVHLVEPRVVLEIAFDRIQESRRHKSGYALRFPRIARIRDDKAPEQASTIDEVRRIHVAQLERESGA